MKNRDTAGPGSHETAAGAMALITAARAGSVRAAGRLLTLIEGDRREEVLELLAPAPIRVVGFTGPPGAGRSTTIAAVVAVYRAQGLRAAVLAVDPSSPYGGGALLGDRIRMAALSYELVVIESVGVGQSEIEIAAAADPAVVVLTPGAGDAVQAAKAGLLEVADLLLVNKTDRPGAEQTARELRAESDAPIHTAVATTGTGIPELVAAIDDHHRADTAERRAARARAQILSLAHSRLRSHPGLDTLAAGRRDPYTAAELLAP